MADDTQKNISNIKIGEQVKTYYGEFATVINVITKPVNNSILYSPTKFSHTIAVGQDVAIFDNNTRHWTYPLLLEWEVYYFSHTIHCLYNLILDREHNIIAHNSITCKTITPKQDSIPSL